ncbi:MAG: DUF7002 family protein [Candidatus Binataceae bacterium]
MPITVEQFAVHYPRLYHMAEAGVWPSIARHGLLSTTALLDLFEVNGALRLSIETEHRANAVTIAHAEHGTVVIRDQKPMRESSLRLCLQGMTPQEWYTLLNGRVFFWVTADRVQTLLNARAYRDKEHTVVTVDTRAFLAKYGDRVAISPINSGSTIYNASRRGRQTFRHLSGYPFDERRRLRGIANAVAEAVVEYAVPDLRDFVLRVERKRASNLLEVVYEA